MLASTEYRLREYLYSLRTPERHSSSRSLGLLGSSKTRTVSRTRIRSLKVIVPAFWIALYVPVRPIDST
jgi:hypothetical protein